MPAPVVPKPKTLRPYLFHGVALDYSEGEDEAPGVCPFCGRDGKKFSVEVETSKFKCFSCDASGNSLTFLRELHARSSASTREADYAELAASRKLLGTDVLKKWGVVRSMIDRVWLIPGYGTDRVIHNLYRYAPDPQGKYRLLSTPEVSHQLFFGSYDPKKGRAFLTEGPWDGIALEEVLAGCKFSDGTGPERFAPTGSPVSCVLADANVIAVPGCNVYRDDWNGLFTGSKVTILFDSDHPREHPTTKQPIPPAGYEGVKRVSGMMMNAATPPASVDYLRWGPDGYDPELKSGYDLRDALGIGGLPRRVAILGTLFDRVTSAEASWSVEHRPRGADGKDLEPVPCSEWKTLISLGWRKALKWPESGTGLDHGLAFMLACVVSTMAVGDQLWGKVVGPASCGKSTLAEGLSVSAEFVKSISTLTGFHSGFKTDKQGAEDHSLVNLVNGKTLIIKDGDTILKQPNFEQIMAEMRDLYDRVSRTFYRHGLNREYKSHSMSVIICGTGSIRKMDQSELGERFLDCVVMEGIDPVLEYEVLKKVGYKSLRGMAYETNGSVKDRQDPKTSYAMQLTGGYVDYLRRNANRLLTAVQETVPEGVIDRCIRLGTFVAYMRARPSTKQEETAEREFGARLTSQLVRLAVCLAVVLNKRTITDDPDDDVMKRVARVALDTARGKTLDIVTYLDKAGDGGLFAGQLALYANDNDTKVLTLLRFLREIGAVELFTPELVAGNRFVKGKPKWRLTPRVRDLYRDVTGLGPAPVIVDADPDEPEPEPV